jgi:group II intron reverse transcriptase/maturase
MSGRSGPGDISTKQQRIAELARTAPQMVLTTLAHHIDINWMEEAYRRTRKNGAPGVDGQGAEQYAQDLRGNLERLLEEAKSGRYRAPPVRRVRIPKEDGKTRPIGIPTFADKVLQRAAVMVLEPVYEQVFLPCSYGFRPGRDAHQALQEIWNQTMEMGGGVVLEMDIRSYFDTVEKGPLQEMVQQRVRDGVLTRLIGKWLQAGVMEEGRVTHPEEGTPQGGVLSPLLANIYLHEVLDKWFEQEVKPRLRGKAALIRYADDAVMVFQNQQDAERVLAVLPKRFGRYGLELHPDKTRLVPFQRPREGGPKPGTFDFLGFTHYWGQSRRGSPVVKCKTAHKRVSRTLKRIAEHCRRRRHDPIKEQHKELSQKLRGHYQYFGLTGNWDSLVVVWRQVQALWLKWLTRRSQRARLTWEKFKRLLEILPLPRPTLPRSIYRVAKP